MNAFLKKYFEIFLGFLSIIFIVFGVFVFIKTIDILIVNLEKVTNLPNIQKSSIEFNINSAISILKERQLIE